MQLYDLHISCNYIATLKTSFNYMVEIFPYAIICTQYRIQYKHRINATICLKYSMLLYTHRNHFHFHMYSCPLAAK